MQIENLNNFEKFIRQNTVRVIGSIQCGNEVTLEVFQTKVIKIKNYIETIKQTIKQYPAQWSTQIANFSKIFLQQKSQEFQKILSLFNQTDNGRVYQIYRIQNQALWDNYISEKNKLIELHKLNGCNLTALEEERYLWHGVKQQHPQIIYEGLKEAFDQTYSNVGLWGQGIYFAENASYSRGYSYTITAKEDQTNQGKLVMLCCLITTGKVDVRPQNSDIKRPNEGFDCVSGQTGGSNVFILYSMDIRRAYPAYEIIFT